MHAATIRPADDEALRDISRDIAIPIAEVERAGSGLFQGRATVGASAPYTAARWGVTENPHDLCQHSRCKRGLLADQAIEREHPHVSCAHTG